MKNLLCLHKTPYAEATGIGAIMGELLTNRLCPRCNLRFRKNPEISGDYDEEGRLLTYCPLCGVMHPPLAVDIQTFNISRRQRHNLGTKIAKIHAIPYENIHELTDSLKYSDDDAFFSVLITKVAKRFGVCLPKEEVANLMGSKRDK